jgi:hypothetical protein
MKKYTPSRFYYFILAIVSMLAIWAVYQLMVTYRAERQITEGFDPFPLSNQYFGSEDRYRGTTDVYTALVAGSPDKKPVYMENTLPVGSGQQMNAYRGKMPFREVYIPKMAPKAEIVSGVIDYGVKSFVKVSFLLPEKTARTELLIQTPDSQSYDMYIPITWNYLKNNQPKIITDSLFIPRTVSQVENTRRLNEWISTIQFKEGDFRIYLTQVQSSDAGPKIQYKVIKVVNGSPATIVEESKDFTPSVLDVSKTYDFVFTQDVEEKIYTPRNETEYKNFTRELNNFGGQRQMMRGATTPTGVFLSSPYYFYPKPGNPQSQGLSLQGFKRLANGEIVPVTSNLQREPFPINTVQISSGGFQLVEATSSATLGGYVLSNPRLMVKGRTILTIPAPIPGQIPVVEVKMKVELMAVGRFYLKRAGQENWEVKIDARASGSEVCPPDAPFRYGSASAGFFCKKSATDGGNLCCLVKGTLLGTQGNPMCSTSAELTRLTREITWVIPDRMKGAQWVIEFEYEEPPSKPALSRGFKVLYQLKNELNQLAPKEYTVIPSTMLTAPEYRYLSFSSTGVMKESQLALVAPQATKYMPNQSTTMTGLVQFIPKIEWVIESLTAPLDALWSMTGDGENETLSPLIRIRSKKMKTNDAVYYLSVDPATNQVGVSLDGGGYQSAWQMEFDRGAKQFSIRSGYKGLDKPYLCYSAMAKDGEMYLLRSNVYMDATPCMWEVQYATS